MLGCLYCACVLSKDSSRRHHKPNRASVFLANRASGFRGDEKEQKGSRVVVVTFKCGGVVSGYLSAARFWL